MFDTYQLIKDFKKSGFPEKQAKILADTLSKTRKTDLSYLDTKEQLANAEEKLNARIENLGEKLRLEIKALEVAIHKRKFDIIKWLVGTIIASTGIFTAIVKFLLA